MSQQPISVGENFKLKSLSDPYINIEAYYTGFININSVEPSLGLPSNNTYTSPNSTYYFPVIANNSEYGNSRKFTNNGNLLTINSNNVGIGTASPNKKLTVVGDISASYGRLYADDLPYTMVFSNSSIKATQGNNQIYDNFFATPTYSNINGGRYNQINGAPYSTIVGGYQNNITLGAATSFIGNGCCNTNSAYDQGFIGSGLCNLNTGGYSSIINGICNCILNNSEASFIAGGSRNIIDTGEGEYNGIPYPDYDENYNDESYSFIGTGSDNFISGIHSAILAGRKNSLSGSNSFIFGSNISTDVHNTTFVNNLSSQGKVETSYLFSNSARFINIDVDNNLTIHGNLTTLGITTSVNTIYSNTSAISVVNFGVGPAIYAQQVNGNYDIAKFVSQYYVPVLDIKNSSYGGLGKVGINTDSPNSELTVVGDISASGIIYGHFNGIIDSQYIESLSANNIYANNLPYTLIDATSSIKPVRGFNTASGYISNVGGGLGNTASGYISNVGGGLGNTASGYISNVGGGCRNTASGMHSNVAGGRSNTASGYISNVNGGAGNTASGRYANTAGLGNTASGDESNVSGGYGNTASNRYANVAGGRSNIASGYISNIAGGAQNTASGDQSNVAGGNANTASGLYASTVSGGGNNTSSGDYSTVSGGSSNIASGNYSAILGGYSNNTNHQDNTFILGSNITASQPNTTYVENLSTTGTIYGNGNEVIMSDGISLSGNGENTLSLNFTNGVHGSCIFSNRYYGNRGNECTVLDYNSQLHTASGGIGGNIYLNGGDGCAETNGDLSIGGNGGCIDLRGGNGYAFNANGGDGGSIRMIGSNGIHGYFYAGSIDTSAGNYESGGNINTNGGPSSGGNIDTSSRGSDPDNTGGCIYTYGADGNCGGNILTFGGPSGSGGTINTSSQGYDSGGSINTSSGFYGSLGGSINTSSNFYNRNGGNINTSDGGGSINTTGSGYIQFGYDTTRTTLSGTATQNRIILLPNTNGTIVVATSGIKNFAAPVTSTSVTTVTKTIQVFDSNGNSLGYIPIYSTRA